LLEQQNRHFQELVKNLQIFANGLQQRSEIRLTKYNTDLVDATQFCTTVDIILSTRLLYDSEIIFGAK